MLRPAGSVDLPGVTTIITTRLTPHRHPRVNSNIHHHPRLPLDIRWRRTDILCMRSTPIHTPPIRRIPLLRAIHLHPRQALATPNTTAGSSIAHSITTTTTREAATVTTIPQLDWGAWRVSEDRVILPRLRHLPIAGLAATAGDDFLASMISLIATLLKKITRILLRHGQQTCLCSEKSNELKNETHKSL